MADVLEYKCPCCGGAINFDSNLQQMKCPYCDTTFNVEDMKSENEAKKHTKKGKMDWENYDSQSGSGDWQQGETDGFIYYVCRSCGGQIMGDENTAATNCPYCGNPVVITDKFNGLLRPDLVIPFKLDKEYAKNALNKHLGGKFLLPKLFKDRNRIDSITGIYVPFWLYNCDADGSVNFKATRVSTWSDSNYNYTKTDHYSLFRAGSVSFDNVPVDGSKKIDDTTMEAIEPFDMSQAVDFKTAYLAGYLADKFDRDANQSIPRANERIKNSLTSLFESTTVGYSTCRAESANINTNHGNVSYALLPVWMLNTIYEGKTYTFAMNAQTGKFIGDLPCDKKKFWATFAGVATAASALAAYFFFFL